MRNGKKPVLSLTLLLLLGQLAGCKYPSKAEARQACGKWEKEGGSYTIMPKEGSEEILWEALKEAKEFHESRPFDRNPLGSRPLQTGGLIDPLLRKEGSKRTEPVRHCIFEMETNQIIGWETAGVKAGSVIKYEEEEDLGRNIVKRFRY